MKPILNQQISDMDRARMEFINALNDHINKVRDELRISELIMHSVVRSLSTQDDTTAELDEALQQLRQNEVRHKPLIKSANGEAELEETLQRAVRESNAKEARGEGRLRDKGE